MNRIEKPSIQQVSCLLLDGFSSLACASATAPLIAFNQLAGETIYHIDYLGYGESVSNDTEQSIKVDVNFLEQKPAKSETKKQMLIICGGSPANYPEDKQIIEDIAYLKHQYHTIVGVGTGSYCLARSGLLQHKKASVHWWSLSSLREQFPDIFLSSDLFSIDGDIATCRSGSSALDLMFMMIGQSHGTDMVDALSQYFLKERIGISGDNIQRVRLEDEQINNQPKLATAITLMEANIEEPLTTDDIAHHVDMSTRQLERLFKRHLKTSPSRYYLHIRLDQARTLLLSSGRSVTEIALACGFASTAHFSTSYRNLFGFTPTEDRVLTK